MSVVISKIEPADRYGQIIGLPITDIPEPISYSWSKQDISDQNSGRTITGDALKLKVGEARAMEFKFNGDMDTVSKVFRAFNHNYFWMTFIDAMAGGYVRKHCYCGDFKADMYQYSDRMKFWNDVAVKVIQSTTDK